MKIKLKKKNKSLIKLYLIKYIVNSKKNYFNNFNTLTIELKQALKIIYLFSLKKKKILFIGFNYFKFVKPHLNSNFVFIDSCLKTNFKYSPDLIICNYDLFKDEENLKTLIKNFNSPLMVLGNLSTNMINIYNIFLSLNNKGVKKFCFFFIFSTINKHKKYGFK